LIPLLEKIIKSNFYECRKVALKSFITVITYCKNAPRSNEEIKTARIGLMKIAPNFLGLLSKLFMTAEMNDSESNSLLECMNNFAWICKKDKLEVIFLEEINQVTQLLSQNVDQSILKRIDLIISLLSRVKLTAETASQITGFAELLSKHKLTEKKGYRVQTLILQRYN
jgi:hypothetical protein